MQIQVNTDNQTNGGVALTEHVTVVLEGALTRFRDRITRVEVHIGDENSGAKAGAFDKRCLMEARVAGVQPIIVRDFGATIEKAVAGAADKLSRALARTLDQKSEHRGRTPYGGE